ncbi:MAG: DUF4301 family protein [Bacteroidota bacterium]
MFREKDLQQISAKKIDISEIEQQIVRFYNGFPFSDLHSPASIENKGILKFGENEVAKMVESFDEWIFTRSPIKFVPASGAATRMFKSLFSFIEKYDKSDKAIQDFNSDKSLNSVFKFINEIENFAFYEDLKKVMSENDVNINECLSKKDYNTIIRFLLSGYGLNYSALPKGLLKFHKYPEGPRTSFEEHLVEAAIYCSDAKGAARIHFTISSEYIDRFQVHINGIKAKYEKMFPVKFDISYSVQKPSTDTIAVDMENSPFREAGGELLFRPGGHGALIENLNDMKGDIIFIKNIDNIVPDSLKQKTVLYKKVLAAYLIELQKKIFGYLKILDEEQVSDEILSEIFLFTEHSLNIKSNDKNFSDKGEKKYFLKNKLNRPIRVCGMVKNEGEPGGGPFWVKNTNGEISLQIVESSQVNMENEDQKKIFNSSTHFNPVDLVCGVKGYKGNNFNLLKYVDYETGFISVKSKDGKNLKALELPGLWNGAMADWITLFVEVPLITFNPVKTVNDLLRKEHQ